MDKLKELLATLLITRQVVGNVKESLVPFLKKQFKQAKFSYDLYGAVSPTAAAEDKKFDEEKSSSPKTERKVSQVELESHFQPYEGTFEDYLEMFIQFGYVILFSSAYPLAGLCALLNNIFEIRGDAFKLCHVHQRPFGQRVKCIGTWQTAMEMMGIIGCVVNCALIGISGQVDRMFPGITVGQTVVLIVVLEHLMLLVKLLIALAIPDVPSWVAAEMAKIEFERREIHKSALPSSRANSVEIEDVVDDDDNEKDGDETR